MKTFGNCLFRPSPLTPLPGGKGGTRRIGGVWAAQPPKNHLFPLFPAPWEAGKPAAANLLKAGMRLRAARGGEV